MSVDHLLQVTYALLRSETTLAAVRALHGQSEHAAVEGLVELIHRHRTASEAVAAISALGASTNPIVCDALEAALDSPHPSVRLAAVEGLQGRRLPGGIGPLERILCEDESWPVRRAVLHLLASQPESERWRILDAATDPHWRVRHALIRVLLRWGDNIVQPEEIDKRLAQMGTDARVLGVRAYLDYRWRGHVRADAEKGSHAPPDWPLWDWDAAVLLRNLEHLTQSEKREALDEMPLLLRHADERVRALAAKCLRDWGHVGHLVSVVAVLDEPRQDGFGNAVKLLSELDEDRKEELTLILLRQTEPTAGQLAWALDQIGQAVPADDQYTTLVDLWSRTVLQTVPSPSTVCKTVLQRVRRALARLCSRWDDPVTDEWLVTLLADGDPAVQYEALGSVNKRRCPELDPAILLRLLESEDAQVLTVAVTAALRQGCGNTLLAPFTADPDMRVRVRLAEELVSREDSCSLDMIARLQADQHPHIRAAALTPGRAAELIREPARETSWHVLARAAHLARIPLWKLEPAPTWRPAPPVRRAAESMQIGPAEARSTRSLGPAHLEVAPLGISGHYGLPVRGFRRAYEAGVNLMFWEPNYSTMTDFFKGAGPSVRSTIHLIAGTFEADGERVRRDAERVLRSLKVEQVAVFLLFWVQSWKRVTPDVRAALEQLKAEGKIATFGLSTHSRPLAVEALDAGWDPVMVRHSAAHRGVEKEVCPRAAQLGASLITFSNTCYGRLLQAHNGMTPPMAADCYRYTLMQPGVRACLAAPATLAQLEDNLAALRDPVQADERLAYLLSFGEKLYEEETVFRRFVRNVP